MSRQLDKTYNPKEIEPKLYEKWCENKYFPRRGRPEQKAVLRR